VQEQPGVEHRVVAGSLRRHVPGERGRVRRCRGLASDRAGSRSPLSGPGQRPSGSDVARCLSASADSGILDRRRRLPAEACCRSVDRLAEWFYADPLAGDPLARPPAVKASLACLKIISDQLPELSMRGCRGRPGHGVVARGYQRVVHCPAYTKQNESVEQSPPWRRIWWERCPGNSTWKPGSSVRPPSATSTSALNMAPGTPPG